MRAKLKVILPLILLIYIVAEMVLKANNIELCSSSGCALAGELLKFKSSYLNYLGIAGAFCLLVLALIKGEMAQRLYSILLIAMVFFESLLIASQLNLNPEVCKFCLGVYLLLILMLINDNIKLFLTLLPAIGAIFLAFFILAIPKNKSLVKEDGLYLIASKSCPHCKEAKEFLDSKGVEYRVIDAKDVNAYYFAKSLDISKIPIAIKKE
ncbi:MAG: glutaredoxin, partial [Epsilonproteobacteria bacterium]|nr:glutaredoxin [Campylobacterota bacterium]